MATCTNCKTENPPDYAFCLECGEMLEKEPEGGSEAVEDISNLPPTREFDGASCEKCGTANPREYQFCRECGSLLPALDDEGSEGVGPESPAGEPEKDSSEKELEKGERPDRQESLDALIARQAPDSFKTRRLVASKPSTGPAIIHLKDDGSPTVFPLKDSVTIGRVTGEVIIKDDDFLSSEHARVLQEGNGFILLDLDSTNGTFLASQGSVALEPGDLLLVGGGLYRFEV